VRTDNSNIVAEDIAFVRNAAFSFQFPNVLEDGVGHTVDYFADVNASGACDTQPTDHTWQEDLGTVSGDVVLDINHTTNFADICATFPNAANDLDFSGTGFTSNDTQTMYAAVVRADTGHVAAIGETTVASGAFGFNWVGVFLPNIDYNVHYFADVDGNTACDFSSDDVWQEPVGAVTMDIVLAVTHSTSFTDVCSTFP
jgi:hypothetical protein